jgi:hypothetical protein
MKRPTPKSLVKSFLNSTEIVNKRLANKNPLDSFFDLVEYMGIASLSSDLYLNSLPIQIKHRLPNIDNTIRDLISFSETNAKLWAKCEDQSLPRGENVPRTGNGWEWERMPREKQICPYQFGTVTLVSLMLHRKPPNALLDVMPSPSGWTLSRHSINVEYFVDGGFVELLTQGKTSPKWRKAVACYSERMGSVLYEPSMLAYADIIKHALSEDWFKALDSIERAIESWELRSHDLEFREFRSWEGGGSTNFYFQTDLRLCIILRYCFSRKRKLLEEIDLSNFGEIFKSSK